MLISRIPERLMCSVRGIGVAVNVNTFTFSRKDFNFSLCPTPKRCSSSIIINPKSLKQISFDKILCVPITISIIPFFKPSNVSFCCFGVRKRESNPILIG